MSRFIRKTLILAKVETTPGNDIVPTNTDNALLVSNMSIAVNYTNVSRDLIRPYFGASEQLTGTRALDISFDVEISGSGTAGTAPAWGPLLQGCGMTETLAALATASYKPNTDGAATKSLSIYYYDDGVLHKALMARGTVEFSMGVNERPLMKFKFTALDAGVTAVSVPAATLTAWKAPLVITDATTTDITLGGTLTAGVISAGTAYPSKGLMVNLGNEVKFTPLLGSESVHIINRETTGSISLELTAAQEVSLMAVVNANTLQSVGFTIGTAAGYKVTAFGASVQLSNPKKEEMDGRRLIGFDLRFMPVSGNDELNIVAL